MSPRIAASPPHFEPALGAVHFLDEFSVHIQQIGRVAVLAEEVSHTDPVSAYWSMFRMPTSTADNVTVACAFAAPSTFTRTVARVSGRIFAGACRLHVQLARRRIQRQGRQAHGACRGHAVALAARAGTPPPPIYRS